MKKLFILLFCGCCLLGVVNESPAPVQLSKFLAYPQPVESSKLSAVKPSDQLHAMIKWETDREWDNAGFNILRSIYRDRGFKQLNKDIIEGAIDSEKKCCYEYLDTTIKPNVVYYYQIEDVNLDGEKRTLRTIRLEDYITPKRKLTISWASLKGRK